MTTAEFDAKWGDIPTAHADGCPKKFSFDFDTCICGNDEKWDQRNKDLRLVLSTISEAEQKAWRLEWMRKRGWKV